MSTRPQKIWTEVVTGDEPVTAAELASWLRLYGSSETSTLQLLITAAREQVELYCRISIIRKTITLLADTWPMEFNNGNTEWWSGVRAGAIQNVMQFAQFYELPRPPLASITSIATIDNANAVTVWNASNYVVQTATMLKPGRIGLHGSSTWPAINRTSGGIRVIYEAGYANGNVPAGLKLGVMRLAAYLYTNRGDCDGCIENCGLAATLNQFVVMDPP